MHLLFSSLFHSLSRSLSLAAWHMCVCACKRLFSSLLFFLLSSALATVELFSAAFGFIAEIFNCCQNEINNKHKNNNNNYNNYSNNNSNYRKLQYNNKTTAHLNCKRERLRRGVDSSSDGDGDEDGNDCVKCRRRKPAPAPHLSFSLSFSLALSFVPYICLFPSIHIPFSVLLFFSSSLPIYPSLSLFSISLSLSYSSSLC